MNNNCNEIDLSQIASITAFKLSDINIGFPVYSDVRYRPEINTLSWGDGSKINFEKDSVSLNDTESTSVAGVLHTVKLSWTFRCVTDDDYTLLAQLKHNVHCIRMVSFGDIERIIVTGVNGYSFTTEESDGKIKCTMTLRNGQGVMRINAWDPGQPVRPPVIDDMLEE